MAQGLDCMANPLLFESELSFIAHALCNAAKGLFPLFTKIRILELKRTIQRVHVAKCGCAHTAFFVNVLQIILREWSYCVQLGHAVVDDRKHIGTHCFTSLNDNEINNLTTIVRVLLCG